ncbi:MAG: aldo/keto reductase [Acidobacteriota bacterium]|nr:aldo/keto reductase [Acidobacteriota bacterium]
MTIELGSSGIRISPIIMGCWQAGAQYWAGIDDDQSIRAVLAALDAGINSFDTAEEYGEGHSERILAEALTSRRRDAVLMSKVFSNHLRYDQVIKSCERSLRNLGTDYLDLYQIHWPSGSWNSESVPVQETMHALADLKHQGKIRAIGVSNFSRAQLEEVSAYGHIDSVQPPYSLFWRHVEKDIRPWCVEKGVTILAYSPLAQGILAGRFGPDPTFEKGDHRGANKLFLAEHYPRVLAALDRLRAVATRNRITPAQLALAWLIRQPNSCAIAGARNEEQVRDNARAMSVDLSAEDLAEVDTIGMQVAEPFMDDPVPWTWEP